MAVNSWRTPRVDGAELGGDRVADRGEPQRVEPEVRIDSGLVAVATLVVVDRMFVARSRSAAAVTSNPAASTSRMASSSAGANPSRYTTSVGVLETTGVTGAQFELVRLGAGGGEVGDRHGVATDLLGHELQGVERGDDVDPLRLVGIRGNRRRLRRAGARDAALLSRTGSFATRPRPASVSGTILIQLAEPQLAPVERTYPQHPPLSCPRSATRPDGHSRSAVEASSHTVEANDPDHGIDPLVYARRWSILGVLCLSLLIVIIGNTTLNVALPTLARELDASTTSLQWMVDAYSLIFAGMLFTAGTIGDRFGRKGALQFGLALFMAGSVFAAFADTSGMVIGGRAVMGLAAAFVMPSTLSILTNVFPAHERTQAIAIWAGVSGGGAAIGPIASGFLLEHFWWGSVFLVNVPVILIAVVSGAILLPRSKDPGEHPIDVPGATLVDRRPVVARLRDHRRPAQRVDVADDPRRVRHLRRRHRRIPVA